MCCTKKELESKVTEIRELKMMKEEIENQIKAVKVLLQEIVELYLLAV